MYAPTCPRPAASPTSVGAGLTTFLRSCREPLAAEWDGRVQRHPRLRTDNSWNALQVRDHIPQFLDRLTERLDQAADEELHERAASLAAQYGQGRWQQAYHLGELIHELDLLRATLLLHLIEYQVGHPDFGGVSTQFAVRVLHALLDEAIQESVAHFTALRERAA